MKNLYLSVLFIIIITIPCFTQDSPADLGVAAIGLVVSDIEKSEKFYTEIIGMVPAGSFSLDATWSKEAGAANDRPFSVKMFKMVDGKSATILKLAYFDSVGPRPEQSGVDVMAGVNYITLHYDSLDEVVKRIDEAGIKRLGWVKREGYQLIFIRDPDGLFVELVGPPEK